MKVLSAFFAALMLTVSLSSTAEAAPARDCFSPRFANTWRATGWDTLVIREGRRAYEVRTSICPSLRFADRIAFDSYSSWVCAGDNLYTVDFRGRVEERCWITDVVRVR